MGRHVYVIFLSGIELEKVQAAVSKHLEILPKILGDGNSARVLIKTTSAAAINVFLDCSTM